MSVLVRNNASNAASLFVKGAPESVLDRCAFIQSPLGGKVPLDAGLRNELNNKVLAYGGQGLRTLALAVIDYVDSDAEHYKTESAKQYVAFEQNMTFVGLVGMLDPPRPEVRGAIVKCRSAGIRVIVITGDNKNTAETICRQIGVFGEAEVLEGKSYTGREFDALSKEEKVQAVLRASLFSRTEPGHKLQIVELLQEEGLVVAMVRSSRPLSSAHALADEAFPLLRLETESTMHPLFDEPQSESPWAPEPTSPSSPATWFLETITFRQSRPPSRRAARSTRTPSSSSDTSSRPTLERSSGVSFSPSSWHV